MDRGYDEQTTAEIRKRYGRALRAELGNRALSQKALGDAVGVSQAQVSEWVRGTANMTVAQALSVDRALGYNPGTMLTAAGLTGDASVPAAITNDPLLDASAKEVMQWVYVGIVDAVSRHRASSGGLDEDVRDHNLIKHYVAWVKRRVNGCDPRDPFAPLEITPELEAAVERTVQAKRIRDARVRAAIKSGMTELAAQHLADQLSRETDQMADTARSLLGEVVDWLGAPDWTGPQMPDDLARRIAACLKPDSVHRPHPHHPRRCVICYGVWPCRHYSGETD